MEKRAAIEQAEEVDTRKTQKDSQGWEAGTPAPALPSQSSSLCHSTPKTGVGDRHSLLGMVVEQGSQGHRRQTGEVPRVMLPGDEAPKAQSVSGASSTMGLEACLGNPHPSRVVPPLIPQYVGSHLALETREFIFGKYLLCALAAVI